MKINKINITDSALSLSVERFFKKLEKYYPEHKVFAFNSLDKTLQERSNVLSKKIGYENTEAFLSAYGYEMLSGDAVRELRPTVIYKPGHEPEIVKSKVESVLRRLNEAYPDKKIESSIQNEHKNLFKDISGLYQWFGYETSADMLKAYGYDYAHGVRGRKENDHQVIIDEILRRYADKDTLPLIADIYGENPDIKGQIKTLSNKAKALFGMSLMKYLLYCKECMASGVTPTLVKEEKPGYEGDKNDYGAIIEYLRDKYNDAEKPSAVGTLLYDNPEIAREIRLMDLNSKTLFGETLAVYLKSVGILKVAEVRETVEKKKNYLTVKLVKNGDTVYCSYDRQNVQIGNYIKVESMQSNDVYDAEIIAINDKVPVSQLPVPFEEMYIYSRKLFKNEVETIRLSKHGYMFCTVEIDDHGTTKSLYYLSDFDALSVGDLVEVPHRAYYSGSTSGIVKKIEHLQPNEMPIPFKKLRHISRQLYAGPKALEKLGKKENNLVAEYGAAEFERKPISVQTIDKFNKTVYFAGAIIRGTDLAIMSALNLITKTSAYLFENRVVLREGISQISIPSRNVPEIIEEVPQLKVVFFAEIWKTGEVYLGYSESGYSTVTSMRNIGSCDFSFENRDRWTLLHDPTEESFYDEKARIKYTFDEKTDWEKLNFVLNDFDKQLTGNVILPSMPYKKEPVLKVTHINIIFPEKEIHTAFPEVREKTKNVNVTDTSLSGKTFVVTGDLYKYPNRNEFKAMIEEHGGKLSGSVSAKTTALITNFPNSGTSKIASAKQLGIEIIDEETFINRYIK